MKPAFLIAMFFMSAACNPIAMTTTMQRPAPSGVVSPTVKAFTDRLNTVRRREGLRAIYLDPRLALAARNHAKDMARNNYFSHRSLSGARLSDRVARTGYCISGLAENIAFGHRSVDTVFSSWINSPAHRRNMLRPQAVTFGVAENDGIWVLVLGDECRRK